MEIQSDLFFRFVERVCVPLVRTGVVPGLTERFNPTIVVEGEALPIETALDMLLRGY